MVNGKMYRYLALGLVFVGPTGCLSPEEIAAIQDNQAPSAALRAPVIAPEQTPVAISAAASFDADGDPLTYIFEIGGVGVVTSARAETELVFPAPNRYTVRVRVVDIHGAEAIAWHDVTIRSKEGFPDSPDFCQSDADCTIGDECDGGICYANGGAVDF